MSCKLNKQYFSSSDKRHYDFALAKLLNKTLCFKPGKQQKKNKCSNSHTVYVRLKPYPDRNAQDDRYIQKEFQSGFEEIQTSNGSKILIDGDEFIWAFACHNIESGETFEVWDSEFYVDYYLTRNWFYKLREMQHNGTIVSIDVLLSNDFEFHNAGYIVANDISDVESGKGIACRVYFKVLRPWYFIDHGMNNDDNKTGLL